MTCPVQVPIPQAQSRTRLRNQNPTYPNLVRNRESSVQNPDNPKSGGNLALPSAAREAAQRAGQTLDLPKHPDEDARLSTTSRIKTRRPHRANMKNTIPDRTVSAEGSPQSHCLHTGRAPQMITGYGRAERERELCLGRGRRRGLQREEALICATRFPEREEKRPLSLAPTVLVYRSC